MYHVTRRTNLNYSGKNKSQSMSWAKNHSLRMQAIHEDIYLSSPTNLWGMREFAKAMSWRAMRKFQRLAYDIHMSWRKR